MISGVTHANLILGVGDVRSAWSRLILDLGRQIFGWTVCGFVSGS